MGKRFGSTARVIVSLFLALFVASITPAVTTHAMADDTTAIAAKALTDHECDASEWHFVITSIDSESNAPASITVNFANSNSVTVSLDKYTGKTAHYTTTTNLDSTVTSATALIYSGWGGQFNLSHGPCTAPTETTEVSVTAPTKTDVCGKYSDSYAIPTKTGVVYKVNGVPIVGGTYYPSMANATSVTITAEAAGSQYILTGQTSWTFDFTNEACDTVSVEDSGECVNKLVNNGEFTVTVHNNNGIDVYYVVLINNGAQYDGALVSNGDWYTFTFGNYAPGDYNISVIKVTSNSGPLTIPANFVEQMLANVPLTSYNFKQVYTGSVTLDACPCDEEPQEPTNPGDSDTPTTPPSDGGQVLGDDTTTPNIADHILATSTNVPNVLPNTGAPATNPWLTVVAAVIAFLAVRAITRKKIVTDQI